MNGAEIKGDKVTLDLETKKGDKETLDADVVLVCAGSFLVCATVMHDPCPRLCHECHQFSLDKADSVWLVSLQGSQL